MIISSKKLHRILGMALVLILLIIITLLTSFSTMKDVYRVEVKVRLKNCSSTVTLDVEARSTFEARDKAEKLAIYQVSAKATKTTKLNK